MEKIILVLVAIIPLMYQIVSLKGIEYRDIQYIPMLLLNLVLLSYFYKNKIKLKKQILIILWMLIMAVLIIPFVMSKVSETTFFENIKYIGYYINFIFTIILLSSFLKSDNYKKIIGSFLCGNTVILGINIIKNIKEISISNCIHNVSHLFKLVDNKQIIYFGFNHPNIAALFIITEMFLLYKLGHSYSNRNKYISIIMYLCIVILIMPLISTGSRTAIIGGIAFCIFNISFWCLFKAKTFIKFIVLTVAIGLLSAKLGSINFTKMFFAESMKMRLSEANELINYLIINNKILTGIGPVSNTLTYANTTGIENTLDNGYLAFGCQYGLIGLCLVLVALVYIFYINFNKRNNTNCSLILVFLVYSCEENILFIPRVLICLLVWIFIVYSDNYKINENSINENNSSV